MPEVRAAERDDIAQIARTLAAAFHDDPVFQFCFGDRDMSTGLERFFRVLTPIHLQHHEVYVGTAVEGASLWDPPGHWKLSVRDQLRAAPSLLRTFGLRAPVLLADFARMEKIHASQPSDHYYLAVLGTDPEHQGRGFGSALMQPVLERADADGVGAYLESSKEANLAFYRRHGFEVVCEHAFHPGGPSVWPMWREPQPPGSR